MAKPLVAIVGRPNVGKSMLFNKLTGHRTSIVEDTPGVTRDRIYGDCEWCGRKFSLVDTGGIEPGTDSDMLKFMRRQAEIGIELADAIVMVVDVRSGVTAADQDVATMLRKSRKPVALAVNKCDSIGLVDPEVFEFYGLGIGDLFETSAVHGHGTGDLLDWVLENIPADDGEDDENEIINVTIVGKPNVGKSSLLNKILGEERVIVSNVAGTTRDAIDSYYENETGKYCLIDTAGMRRKSKVDDIIEKYSNMRTISAIDRADVCLILIDANEGVTEQDTKIAGLVHEAGKAAIIVVNKWDAVENKEANTMRDMERQVRDGLSYSADELELIEARLDTIHRLRRKYGASCEDILQYMENATKELDEIEFADDHLERLKGKLKKAEAAAAEAALALREVRKAAAQQLAERILTELSQLDMPRVQFSCHFSEKELSTDGADSVIFYMSANVGEALKSMSKVASGGELARIMLAMKNVLAEKDQVPTLIFDEVDTGVSGRAAQKVAEKLRSVAAHKQVLCVTHLPQLAALANTHFLIAKEERDGRTYTNVTPLELEGRKRELARIIGGANITDTTLKSAEEMLNS